MFPTAPILCSLVHYSFEVINKSETGTRDAIMPPIVLKCPPLCVHCPLKQWYSPPHGQVSLYSRASNEG